MLGSMGGWSDGSIWWFYPVHVLWPLLQRQKVVMYVLYAHFCGDSLASLAMMISSSGRGLLKCR
jgi:hypothetical protein